MPLRLTFQLVDDGGRFAYPDQNMQPLYDRLDEIESRGRVCDLFQLICQEPQSLELRAKLAHFHIQQQEYEQALTIATEAVSMAKERIPATFNGRIEWGELDNRPFLRLLGFMAIANVHLRRHKEAVSLIELSMKYNPSDNTGLREYLGSELLRNGSCSRAKTVLRKYAGTIPSCQYELALSYLTTGEWALAATALRQGFHHNPYIAEMICGSGTPTRQVYWHGTNFHDPDYAAGYMELYGSLWKDHPEHALFVRWLFNHPRVMQERAAVLACREALLWSGDITERQRIVHQLDLLLNGTRNDLSEELVAPRTDLHGNTWRPWLRFTSDKINIPVNG
ncbi:TPA: hypothetical protein QHB43_003389 [Aeromonas hydrophila subsp. hydrophila]|nr:hypothetical protein [Aeromonas hydrophila subsp. hydrophila]